MNGSIWTVAILLVLGGVAVVGLDVQHDDAASVVLVAGEEHTISNDSTVTLEAADDWTRLYQNETVTDANDTELERGEDYYLDHDSGELWADEQLGETDVTVDYAYDEHDEDTSAIAGLLEVGVGAVIGLLALVAACGVLISWFGRFGGGGR